MKTKQHNQDQWMSISDMMTGLMIVFMFIAINYIIQASENKFVERDIYNSLSLELATDIQTGDIQLSPDGTIRMRPNDNSNTFSNGSSKLTKEFKNYLDYFIPKYLGVIGEHIEQVKEIRIEGHIDTTPLGFALHRPGNDSYEDNLWLSSERAQSVLVYIKGSNYFKSLSQKEQERLCFLFTATGKSFSEALNDEGQLVYINGGEINKDLSRRVEFKVTTSSELLITNLD